MDVSKGRTGGKQSTDDWQDVDDWADAPDATPAASPAAAAAPGAPEAPTDTGPGGWEALGRGGLQGATAGFSDEMAGSLGGWGEALRLGGEELRDVVTGKLRLPRSLDEAVALGEAKLERLLGAYRAERDDARAKNAAAQEAHPYIYGGGNVLGGIATAGITPAVRAAQGAGLAARAGAGLLNGASQGALYGFGASNSDLTKGEVGQASLDTAVGGGVGAGLGAAFPVLGQGLRSLYRGVVRPNEAATFLRSRGIPLTLGQMRPNSVVGQLEEASTSVGGIGPQVAAQREAAREAWQTAVMNEARAPGSPPLDTSRTLQERLADAYEGYRDAYAIPRAAEVRPETAAGAPLAEAFARAVDDPSALATRDTQSTVARFLDDQLSLLGQARRPEMGDRLPADTLLAMRSNIREAIRNASRAGDVPQLRLLENAEAQVTDALESQMPDWARDALHAADQRYSQYKVVEDAVARAKDNPAGFSPFQLGEAVRSSAEKGAYARGAGGELRELASAGRQALDMRAPQTGVRLMVTPPVIREGVAGLSYLSNLPRAQQWMTGQAPLQQRLQALEQGAAGDALRRALPNPAAAGTRALLPHGGPPPHQATGPESPSQPPLQQVVLSQPQAFGRFAPALIKAAQEGDDELAITHHVLMQTDPEYQEMMRQMGGEQ